MSYAERLLETALKIAADSDHHKWRVGCLLLQGRTVIASSPNKPRHPPTSETWTNSTFHAEHAALRRLRSHHKSPTLAVVARVNKLGIPRLARPCTACWTKLVEAGISQVIYSTNTGYGLETIVSR